MSSSFIFLERVWERLILLLVFSGIHQLSHLILSLDFLFIFYPVLIDCKFLEMYYFLLGYLISWHIIIYSIHFWSCFYVISGANSPLSLLILFIWLFFLMHLAKDLSILFAFPKTQLLLSLIFSIDFWVFISTLFFIIFFLLLTLGFVVFLVPLNVHLDCLLQIFLVSWDRAISPWTCLLEQLLWHPIDLDCCVSIFFVSRYFLFF